MDDGKTRKLKFIKNLIDMAEELGLEGCVMLDEDGEVFGLAFGEEGFLELLDFKDQEIMQ